MPAYWTKFTFPMREAVGGRLCSKAPNRLSPCQWSTSGPDPRRVKTRLVC
jgi:hypothetical protein